ncbi:solute carrier family 46 member 2-like [Brevipalpus obovatus]|uniref:solute carrier family 46 member 2-like n=1 Tax=Brevipalpus obovatus TaxID=246614 RepID=UPI003D9E670B
MLENYQIPTKSDEEQYFWKKYSCEDVKRLARLCTLDVYVFLFCFGLAISNITGLQIIQDKVCLNELKLPPEICYNIEKRSEYVNEAVILYKAATVFRTYENLIIFIPSILVTLCSGRLLDKYPQHLKYFFAVPVIGVIIHNLLMIYHIIHFDIDYRQMYWVKTIFGITGNIALFYSASYTYVLRYTPQKYREVRFGMIDFAMHMGFNSSMSAGGTILVSSSWFYPRLRNFLGVYGSSAIVNVIALIWIVAVIRTSDLGENQASKDKCSNDQRERKENSSTTDQTIVQGSQNDGKVKSKYLDNITEMAKTCAKKRENGNHIRLWWCLACVCLSQICIMGELTVVFQFAQKVYGWDAQYFSNLKTVTGLIPTFGAILFPVILVNKMKLRDTTLGIIGSYSLIFSCLIKGGFLIPAAFYLGEAVSVFTEMMSIAFRTIVARLISSDEYGQIFTVLSCIQTSAMVSSSILYTSIFNNTLNWYPGLVYHTVALMMFMPYIVLIWIDLSQRRSQNRKNAALAKQTIKLEKFN